MGKTDEYGSDPAKPSYRASSVDICSNMKAFRSLEDRKDYPVYQN